MLKSFTFVWAALLSKNIPTNLSFVPVIFPPIKSWVVCALTATIPVASSPVKLISPLFFNVVFVKDNVELL